MSSHILTTSSDAKVWILQTFKLQQRVVSDMKVDQKECPRCSEGWEG